MYQLFTVFVLCLGFSGCILAFPLLDKKFRFGEIFQEELFLSPRLSLIMSIVLTVLAVLRLIFATAIPVVGDILPVLAALLAAIMLLSDYMMKISEAPSGFFTKISDIFLKRRSLFGVLILIVSLLHFIFPAVPVL